MKLNDILVYNIVIDETGAKKDLGKIRSQMKRLICHIIKLKEQPKMAGDKWIHSINSSLKSIAIYNKRDNNTLYLKTGTQFYTNLELEYDKAIEWAYEEMIVNKYYTKTLNQLKADTNKGVILNNALNRIRKYYLEEFRLKIP